MVESGAKYTSRQWMIMAFLGVLILASLFIITDFSGLGIRLSLVASGKPLNYLDTVDFPDIEELDGLFPDEDLETDNTLSTSVLNAATITLTPTLTNTPTPSPTTTPAPKKVPPTKTVAPTPIPTTLVPTTAIRDYSKPWEVAPGCPASTLNCVPCILGQNDYCRVETGETHGFLGWSCQNNNPGNIRNSTYRDSIIENNGGVKSCGTRYDSRGGSYMVFASYITGFNSLKAYLRGINDGEHTAYKDDAKGIYCGDCTLRFFAEKYSTNTTTYANNLASYLGVNADTATLRSLVENRLDDLASGIQHVEGFYTQ